MRSKPASNSRRYSLDVSGFLVFALESSPKMAGRLCYPMNSARLIKAGSMLTSGRLDPRTLSRSNRERPVSAFACYARNIPDLRFLLKQFRVDTEVPYSDQQYVVYAVATVASDLNAQYVEL